MPTPADAEMSREWEIYKLALQAIQYSAIAEAVKKARAEREMAPVAPAPAIIRHIPFMTRVKANGMKNCRRYDLRDLRRWRTGKILCNHTSFFSIEIFHALRTRDHPRRGSERPIGHGI